MFKKNKDDTNNLNIKNPVVLSWTSKNNLFLELDLADFIINDNQAFLFFSRWLLYYLKKHPNLSLVDFTNTNLFIFKEQKPVLASYLWWMVFKEMCIDISKEVNNQASQLLNDTILFKIKDLTLQLSACYKYLVIENKPEFYKKVDSLVSLEENSSNSNNVNTNSRQQQLSANLKLKKLLDTAQQSNFNFTNHTAIVYLEELMQTIKDIFLTNASIKLFFSHFSNFFNSYLQDITKLDLNKLDKNDLAILAFSIGSRLDFENELQTENYQVFSQDFLLNKKMDENFFNAKKDVDTFFLHKTILAYNLLKQFNKLEPSNQTEEWNLINSTKSGFLNNDDEFYNILPLATSTQTYKNAYYVYCWTTNQVLEPNETNLKLAISNSIKLIEVQLSKYFPFNVFERFLNHNENLLPSTYQKTEEDGGSSFKR